MTYRENIKLKIMEKLSDDDLLIVEVDVNYMPMAKAELYMKSISKKFDRLKFTSNFIVIPKRIKISKILKSEPAEVAKNLDVGWTAEDLMEL